MAMNRTIAAIASLSFAAAAAAQQQQMEGIDYRSGGIGQAEQQAMREARDDYSLGMTFATRQGAYVADVDVMVKNASGDVMLTQQSQGPMLLVDLPAGRYTVEATANGRTLTQQVSVPASGHRQITLNWDR